MVMRQLELKNNIMKIVAVFMISLLIIFSCNPTKKNKIKEKWVEINDEKEFNSTLNDFLEKTIVKDSGNSILIHFYTKNKKDTILKISNSPILNCYNYSGYSKFNDRFIFVFCSKSLENRLKHFVKFKRDNDLHCIERIDTSGLYISDEISFKMKNGKLVR